MGTTSARAADRPHPCPHCRCTHPDTVDMGYVDKSAPMYPLVELVMEATR